MIKIGPVKKIKAATKKKELPATTKNQATQVHQDQQVIELKGQRDLRNINKVMCTKQLS